MKLHTIAFSRDHLLTWDEALQPPEWVAWQTRKVADQVVQLLQTKPKPATQSWGNFARTILGEDIIPQEDTARDESETPRQEPKSSPEAQVLFGNQDKAERIFADIDKLEDGEPRDMRWYVGQIMEMRSKPEDFGFFMPGEAVVWEMYVQKCMFATLDLLVMQARSEDLSRLNPGAVSKAGELATVRNHFERIAQLLGKKLDYPKLEVIDGLLRAKGKRTSSIASEMQADSEVA